MTSSNAYWKEREDAKEGPIATLAVVIDDAVYQKINYWIQKAPGEVSGLGKIVVENGTFRVIDAILIKQENTAASTDLDPAEVARAMYELRETPGHLNFWWHSHVNMGVFWSGTDTDTIREIGRHGFVVSTVLNKRHEMLSSLYVKANGPLPEVFVNNLSTTVARFLPKVDTDAWDADYNAKCAPCVYTYPYHEPYQGSWSERWGYQNWKDKDGNLVDLTDPHVGKTANEGFGDSTVANDDGPTDVTVDDDNDEPMRLDDLEDLVEDMESEPRHKEAMDTLVFVTSEVMKIASLPYEERAMMKKDYIERFNLSRHEHAAKSKGDLA